MAGVYRERRIGHMTIRDDGYRIEYRIDGNAHWALWAEYKQCNNQRDAATIADVIMQTRNSPQE